MTECNQTCFSFATESHQEVVARFDGGAITTEAGGDITLGLLKPPR